MTTPSSSIDFVTLDVFTDRRFAGNPLAVVLDARHLDDCAMQAIAAEFNLSETVFVLPPKDPAHRARIRIFTPRHEMPFAGHPNVGAAWALAAIDAERGLSPDHYQFEEIAGIVTVELRRNPAHQLMETWVRAPQALKIGESVAIQEIAAACDLVPDAIRIDRHPPVIASCGAAFALVELSNRAALSAARPNFSVFMAAFPAARANGIYLYVGGTEPLFAPATQSNGGPLETHARMFAPPHGIKEDPATGAAAAALAAMMAHVRAEASRPAPLSIWQGEDMGRPSLIHAQADATPDGKIFASIGGCCVPVMRGTLRPG